jgi:hypothetical protein
MTDLENLHPFDEGNDFLRPILPLPKRNRRRDKVIGEGESMI